MRLVVLGSSGGYPGPGRACSGYLLEIGEARFWVDAGSGTLAELNRHCTLPELDAIFITHLHADHWTDLPLAVHTLGFMYPDTEPVPVYGPAGFVDACGITLRWRLETELPTFDPHELHDGFRTEVAGAQITSLRVQHGDLETYGLRIAAPGSTFAYSADAAPCKALVPLARDADLFLCEAGAVDESSTMHLNPVQAATIATEAAARCLVLTHLDPKQDPRRVEELARSTFAGRLVVAWDGLSVEPVPRGT